MEQFSRRIWAPAAERAQRETKWFYERARGQYADAKASLTPAEKKKFELENPKSQMFTKTDLAKFENVWDDEPRLVNMGAQKNFGKYAERIGKEWEKDKDAFNEQYYRRAIARAIVFRSTEKLISNLPWYGGGYRANIVAYTISVLSEIIRRRKKWINAGEIWQKQRISQPLENTLAIIAKEVHESLTNPPNEGQNISEWAKKPLLWTKLQEKIDRIDSQLPDEFFASLIDKEQRNEAVKSAKKQQRMDNDIEALTKVVNFSGEQWKSLRNLLQEKDLLNSKEDGLLKVAMQIPLKIPTEKQCAALLQIVDKAALEGILIEKL